MCRKTVVQHFHFVTLLDLILSLTFAYYEVHTYTIPSSTPEKPFGKKFGFAAVISPVSVADQAKSNDFDL